MEKLQWINHKIFNREHLLKHVHALRATGKKIVFTNGCFDILHYGHIDYLSKAADLGDMLIIGVNTDASVKKLKGEERPINHEKDRLIQLAALLITDAVCLFDEDTPLSLIKDIMPDVLVKGGDYTIETIVGAKEVMDNGGQVEVIPFVDGYSTSGIISKIQKL